jgi:chromosome segregation ATPase
MRRAARHFPHTDEELSLLNPVGGGCSTFSNALQQTAANLTMFSGLICVNMKNFMCHRNFTQNFYAGVNYITGENGSGKSAVIVGLSAALGANCNKIGKGDDVSNLIGTAEPIATITVTLRNDPSNPRHSNKYKDPVVIERTLVRRGEAGKISNKNSIKIDGKDVRKVDLVELMSLMSIDIDNPAVILHQDAAKSFGECNDGKDLYKYFLDATGLRQSLSECERCKDQTLADKAVIKQCLDVKKKLEEGEYALAKKERDKCSDLSEQKRKIDELKVEHSVLVIHEVVEKYDDQSAELVQYREKKVESEMKLAQLQREMNEVQAEVAAVEQQERSELDAEMDSINQQLRHLNKKKEGCATDIAKKNNEKLQVERTIRTIEKQIKDEEKLRDEARAEFERQDRNQGKRAAAKLR